MTDDRTAQIGQLLAQLATLVADQPTAREPEPVVRPTRLLFTVEEAAEQLGIGKTTAYAYVRTGELESVLIGRLRRIHADAIAGFAARLVARNRAA
ncbi:helix-turn-helix domain-containing protein [Pseudonocardia sp. ICBG601]|uniref:helix-turn-helix domain-containing protein n=1 Tax=Pseudonocardia sp. ICBG601 TaxID=2846759 RepID=UPI001CF68C65|nr:helix-turn-helix domain-containing protein [Pseudonocardia sp. ICBG601]